MKYSPLPHLPLIAKYDAVWPPRHRIGGRGFSSAVEMRGLTVTTKRGLLKRSVSYDPQLPPPKKGRYHPNSIVNEYDSEANFRSLEPPSGYSRSLHPGGEIDLRRPLSRSSLDSIDRPLLDHPPGFHDSFRPAYPPQHEPHRTLLPYHPPIPPISRYITILKFLCVCVRNRSGMFRRRGYTRDMGNLT